VGGVAYVALGEMRGENNSIAKATELTETHPGLYPGETLLVAREIPKPYGLFEECSHDGIF